MWRRQKLGTRARWKAGESWSDSGYIDNLDPSSCFSRTSFKKNVKNSQAEITFSVLKCLCMCNCVSNFMTNEEQELAVRVLYPLAYYSTLSVSLHWLYCGGVYWRVWGCVCLWAPGFVCNSCDKWHAVRSCDVYADCKSLSWMQSEGGICERVLNAGWLADCCLYFGIASN